MTISVDQLQVTSFDTTAEPIVVAGPVTPMPVCDSPLCVPSWNGTCPEAGC